MKRRVPPLAFAALVVAGCGDPIVVLGDAPGFMRIVAGVGDSIGTRVDTLATRTRMTEPTAIAFDHVSGTLYVADRGSLIQTQGVNRPVARLFAITSNARLQLLLDRGGCGATVCIERAAGMTLDRGALLITDDVGHRVYRFDLGSRALTPLAGDRMFGSSPDGMPALTAKLAGPMDVLVGDGGTVYFSESQGHRVRFIAPDGTLRTAAGTGAPGSGGDNGPATQAQLRAPAGIAHHAGTLYIADAENHRVRAVSPAGAISTVAGNGFLGFSGDAGPASAAALANPRDVAVDAEGVTLFIADTDNDRVRTVSLQTGLIRTYAGSGSAQFNGVGPAGATSLDRPMSVLPTPLGFLFIADTGHSIVWRTTLTF